MIHEPPAEEILIPRDVALSLLEGNGLSGDDGVTADECPDHPEWAGWCTQDDVPDKETTWGARRALIVFDGTATHRPYYRAFYDTYTGDNAPDVWDGLGHIKFERVIGRRRAVIDYVSAKTSA